MKSSRRMLRVNATINRQCDPLRFALDSTVWTQDASRRLTLTGWIVHPKWTVSCVCLENDKRTLAKVRLDRERPSVQTRFSEYPNSSKPGFRIELPDPGVGSLTLSALCRSGQKIKIAQLELAKRNSPRVLFVHIPKTAGSAFNNWLSSHFDRDWFEVHVESQERWFTGVEEYRNLDFLSGHLTKATFRRKLDFDGYYSITVMREPFAQLSSHLAWIRRLSDPGEEQRFAKHPEYIQGLSESLAKMDFRDAQQMREFADSLEGVQERLLSNCQLRYFANVHDREEIGDQHLSQAIVASDEFSRIGRTEDIETLVKLVAEDLGWRHHGPLQRENVSSHRYGLDVTNADIRSALEPLVRYDLRLIDEISRRRDEL